MTWPRYGGVPQKSLALENVASLAAGLVCMLSGASLVPLPFLVMIFKTRLQLAESMELNEKELPLGDQPGLVAGMFSIFAVCALLCFADSRQAACFVR